MTRQTFVGKVMSLLFNMLSRLVTVFLPRSKHLLISWLQSPSVVILEPMWQIDGETVETVADFIFGGRGLQITADSDCSHEIKRHLLLGRKVMTNLDCILSF